MRERPDLQRMAENEAKRPHPEESRPPATTDIEKMLKESLAECEIPESESGKPIDSEISPLTIEERIRSLPKRE